MSFSPDIVNIDVCSTLYCENCSTDNLNVYMHVSGAGARSLTRSS